MSATDSNILSWKSKGLPDKSIRPSSTSNDMLIFSLDYLGAKVRVKCNGDCLKQGKITFNHGKIVNIYSVNISSYPTRENCLFGAVNVKKHVDIDLHNCSVRGIGFERKTFFSVGDEVGKNVIIFGVDMSSSPHIDNRKKYILILDKDLTQGLEHTLAAKKLYSINFTKENSKFYLSWHYN